MDRSEAGRKGGQETLRRYTAAHFRELGKKGIRATAARWFGGSVAEAMSWLRKRGTEFQIDRGTDEQLERRLADGEASTAVELPVILDPDDDCSLAEPAPSWRDRVRAAEQEDREIDLPF